MYNTIPVTALQFRLDFPEFSNQATFPDSQVAFWAMVAAKLCNPQRWRSMLTVAMELFIAHNVALERLAVIGASTPGGIPGISRGIVASEAAGAVSVSYDTSGAAELGAGHWNLTTYGQRLYRMAMMFGAGPIQVGISCARPGFLSAGQLGIECGPGWCSGGWIT